MIEFRLIRARINREQQFALLHLLAFLEMNLVEITADARPQLDGFRRFEPPDVFVPFDDFARHGLNDGNGGRWWSRWLRAFSATREKRADQKSGECEPAVRSHGFHSFACMCASTSHNSLSTPRDTSVNRSAVSASPALAAVSMASRVVVANMARALDNAATCFCPDVKFSG